MKLTDKACKTAQPSGTNAPRKLSDGQGLQLWIMKTGSKHWRYKYRILGVEKLLSLGSYPETSLAEARERHRDARKLVEQSIDPALFKHDQKLRRTLESKETFEAIGREWLEKRKKEVKLTTHKNIKRRLEADVFPHIGMLPMRSISPQVMLATIQRIEARGALELARKAKVYSSQIFRYAVVSARAERDITVDIGGAMIKRKRKHQPALEPDKLPILLRALELNEARLFLQTRLALELLLLTFVRPMELASAEWKEIRLAEKEWKIPKEKMKMEKDHVVPLSNQAIVILKRLKKINGHTRHVFVGREDPKEHMHRDTLSGALRELGFKGKQTPHGFRAVARTGIREKLRYDTEIIEKQLAHKTRDNNGEAYDRTEFLEDRVVMMQDWADYVDKQKIAARLIP